MAIEMPTRGELFRLLRLKPEDVWEDEDGRLYGPEDVVKPDHVMDDEEIWWLFLPRKMRDAATSYDPATTTVDEIMVFPKADDELKLSNTGTGEQQSLVFKYFLRNASRERKVALGVFEKVSRKIGGTRTS